MKKRMICFMMVLFLVLSLGMTSDIHAKSKTTISGSYHTTNGKSSTVSPKGINSKGKYTLTLGKTNRYLDTFKVNFSYNNRNGISYKVRYAGSKNWTGWISGKTAGKKGKKIEAVKFKLSGTLAKKYDVRYKAYIDGLKQSQGWVYNGAQAGVIGEKKYIKQIQLWIVPKKSLTPKMSYRSSIKGTWENTYKVEKTTGKAKKDKPLDMFEVRITNDNTQSIVNYNAYVTGSGWYAKNKSNGTKCGQKNKKLEAIKMSLSGKLADTYSVYYRVYMTNYGWLAWTSNGRSTGVIGKDDAKIAAIQVTLVKRSGKSPKLNFGGVKSTDIYGSEKNIAYIGKDGKTEEGVKPGTPDKTVNPSTPKPTATPSEQPSSCANGHNWSKPYVVENGYTSYSYKDFLGCKICGSPSKDGPDESPMCTHNVGTWQYAYLDDTLTYTAKKEKICLTCGAKETVQEKTLKASANTLAGGCEHVIVYEPAFVDKSTGNVRTWQPVVRGGDNNGYDVAGVSSPLEFGCYRRCVKCKQQIGNLVYVPFNYLYFGTNNASGTHDYDIFSGTGVMMFPCWPGFFTQSPDFGTKLFKR